MPPASVVAAIAAAAAVAHEGEGQCGGGTMPAYGDGAALASTAGWPALEPGLQGTQWSAGNHRLAIVVSELPPEANGTVMARVTWRRHDTKPELKNTIVVDARSHLEVPLCTRVEADGDGATVVFKASNGPAEYHLYFMPFTSCEFAGGGCTYGASATYDAVGAGGRGCTDPPSWYAGVPTSAMATPSSVTMQSRTSFSAFPPIEQPATQAELAAMLKTAPPDAPVLMFPEGREQPIRMQRSIPVAWTARDLSEPPAFFGAAQPGEHFTFQVAVYAHKGAVTVRAVTFADIRSPTGTSIPPTAVHCMNTDGSDFWGRPYHPESPILVRPGAVVPLWIAVSVPDAQPAGNYTSEVRVAFAEGGATAVAAFTLVVGGPSVGATHGDDEQWRGTRLTWLDSDIAVSGDTVPPPYVPLSATQAAPGSAFAVTMLDKTVKIGADGMVSDAAVGTRAAAAGNPNFENAVEGRPLSAPLAVAVDGAVASPRGVTLGAVTQMEARWTARASTPTADLVVNASVDATGYCDYAVTVMPTDGSDGNVSVELRLAANPDNALMMMGLGAPGGYIDELPPPPAPEGPMSQWLVLDFKRDVAADAFGLFTSADAVHDPKSMSLQVAPAAGGPWKPAASFSGAGGVVGRQVFKFGDQMVVTSRFWRLIVLDVVPSPNCAPRPYCQAWVGEVQLRVASSGAWIDNSGNATLVVASSGSATPELSPQKAADGVLNFSQTGGEGWDGSFATVPGGARPPPPDPSVVWEWSWDGVNGNNALWVGSSSAGVRLFLKGSDPLWQAGVPFDSRATPDTSALIWNNNGAGGVRLHRNGSATASTGPLSLSKGESTTLYFSVMLTPVRPLNLSKHFGERYVQLGGPPPNYTMLADGGATVVNMHQGNAENPWINYPYETISLMRSDAAQCHALGMKFKIYNTMRELSNRCRELWAMRALNETYVQLGPQPFTDQPDGADWLQEHVQTDFIKAWSNPVQNVYPGSANTPRAVAQWLNDDREQDAAIKVKALSRWNNYYVEGLRQLIDDTNYDGIYLDEIAYDRITMLRSRKVLGADRLIDHHSDKGGFTPSPAANYLELYPFIDSLWYGEGFKYEAPTTAAYWLVEISGVPHGLNADLLRYSGMTPAHFKGMLFGNANRWQFDDGGPDPFDPRALWALWGKFGIDKATLFGWWMDRERGDGTVPVSVSNTSVKATVFARKGEAALVAIASFLSVDTTVTLRVDYAKLGLPAGTALSAPALPPFQPTARVYQAGAPIPVPANQGWIFLIDPKASKVALE